MVFAVLFSFLVGTGGGVSLGALVFRCLTCFGDFWRPAAAFGVFLMLVLYLLDVSYWEGVALVWLRRVLVSFTGAVLLLGVAKLTADNWESVYSTYQVLSGEAPLKLF